MILCLPEICFTEMILCLHLGKVGSYGHSIHHDLERSRLSSVSDVGMDKNHLTSNSTRNNYHKKVV